MSSDIPNINLCAKFNSCFVITVCFLFHFTTQAHSNQDIRFSHFDTRQIYIDELILSGDWLIRESMSCRDSVEVDSMTRSAILSILKPLTIGDCPHILDGMFSEVIIGDQKTTCNNCTSCNSSGTNKESWNMFFSLYHEIDCIMDSSRIANNKLRFADSIRIYRQYIKETIKQNESAGQITPLGGEKMLQIQNAAKNLKTIAKHACSDIFSKTGNYKRFLENLNLDSK